MLIAPRTDPDGRLLAHPVLIADDWRQSERQDKDGGRADPGQPPSQLPVWVAAIFEFSATVSESVAQCEFDCAAVEIR